MLEIGRRAAPFRHYDKESCIAHGNKSHKGVGCHTFTCQTLETLADATVTCGKLQGNQVVSECVGRFLLRPGWVAHMTYHRSGGPHFQVPHQWEWTTPPICPAFRGAWTRISGLGTRPRRKAFHPQPVVSDQREPHRGERDDEWPVICSSKWSEMKVQVREQTLPIQFVHHLGGVAIDGRRS